LSLTLTPPRTSGTVAWQFASAKALEVAEQITVGAVLSVITKLVVQVALLPAASVAVTVIVFVPRPTNVPASGLWLKVIALVGVQLSLTVTPPRTSGTVAWQFASAKALGVAEQITVGAVLSMTVTVAVQVWVLPLLSVTVRVTRLVPMLVQSKLVWLRLRLAMPQASLLPLLDRKSVV